MNELTKVTKENLRDKIEAQLEYYKNKHAALLDEAVIKQYSLSRRVSRDRAIIELIYNFETEENFIDPKAIAIQAMKAIRQELPKLNGLVLREKDTLDNVKQLKRDVTMLRQSLDEQQSLYLELQGKVEEMEKSRIAAEELAASMTTSDQKLSDVIEIYNFPYVPPLDEKNGLYSRIKCLLKKLKTYLLN